MSDKDVVSGPDLAEMIGISVKHLGNLEKAGVIKKYGIGKYGMRESVRNFCQYLRDQKDQSAKSGYDADKARKMKADADLAEIEAAKAAGRLIEAKPSERAWAAAISGAKARLFSFCHALGPQTVIQPSPQLATELLLKEMRKILKDIANAGPDFTDVVSDENKPN